MFTPTQWHTAADKEKFVTRFKAFVKSGFKPTIFTKAFYQRMSMMRGHIAHYDQGGFYDAQFSAPTLRADFLRHWANGPIYGNPTWTWSDVEHALATWLQEHPEYERKERTTAQSQLEQAERQQLAYLTQKYA